MRGTALRRPQMPVARLVWNALSAAAEPVTARDLSDTTGADICAISKRLSSWGGAGLVIVTPGRPGRFTMNKTAATTDAPPTVKRDGRITFRPRNSRERMWSAIRALKRFDLPNLELAAEVTPQQARLYLNCLERTGYLARSGTDPHCPSFKIARQLGPKPPKLTTELIAGKRRQLLVDPNDGSRTLVPLLREMRASGPTGDGGVS